MKTRLIVPFGLLLLAALPCRAQDQTIEGNLTVNQGLFIQQDTNLLGSTTFGRLPENPQMEGLRVSIAQNSWSSTVTNLITPGYWGGAQDVVVEDYGWVDHGYWEPIYDWVMVTDYFPATYDEDGNLLTSDTWGSHTEWQQVGSNWVEDTRWEVVGTHNEWVPEWIPDQVETVEVTNYGAPRILLTATRSDANWVFQAPSGSGGQMRDVLTIYQSGLNMNSEDGSAGWSINPLQMVQSKAEGSANYTSRRQADETEHESYAWWQSGALQHSALAENAMRPEFIRLSRTEFEGGQATSTAQTQIAAKSAQFAGVVTVEGDLKVKGALRVNPAGDLGMGVFHKGLRPDGTEDPGG